MQIRPKVKGRLHLETQAIVSQSKSAIGGLIIILLFVPAIHACTQDVKSQASQSVREFIESEATEFSVPLSKKTWQLAHQDFIPPNDEGGQFSARLIDSRYSIDGGTEGRGNYDFLKPHEEDLVFVVVTFHQVAFWHRGRLDVHPEDVKVRFVCANQQGRQRVLFIDEDNYYSFVPSFIAYLTQINANGKLNPQIQTLQKLAQEN